MPGEEPMADAVERQVRGTDDHGDTQWDADSYCECCACGFFAIVADFSETSSETKAALTTHTLKTLRLGVKAVAEVLSRWEHGDLAESIRALGVWHAEAEAALTEATQKQGGQHR